jgi:arsenate reductase
MALRVLFVCTANAARSQMAEGLLRSVGGEAFEVQSGGCVPRDKVHPLAVRVLSRAQVDIRGQKPKSLEQFRGHHFDYVITLADDVREATASAVSAGERVHWNITDPLGDPTELGFIEVMKQLRRRIELFATVAQRPS